VVAYQSYALTIHTIKIIISWEINLAIKILCNVWQRFNHQFGHQIVYDLWRHNKGIFIERIWVRKYKKNGVRSYLKIKVETNGRYDKIL